MKTYRFGTRENFLWVIEEWAKYRWRIYSINATRKAARTEYNFIKANSKLDVRIVKYSRDYNWEK